MGLPSLSLIAQSVLSGVFIGALYGLLGLGLSLSWGLLRQINQEATPLQERTLLVADYHNPTVELQ